MIAITAQGKRVSVENPVLSGVFHVDLDRLPVFVGFSMEMDYPVVVSIQLEPVLLKLIVIQMADCFGMGA